MKVVTSKCEEEFIVQTIRKGHRVDGRNLLDGRNVEIAFGSDGCCIVMLDNTRILAQVSCEITKPRAARPAEGALHVNLELSPMAAPNFQAGRMSDAGVEAARLLERTVRDSKCIDLESLCIVAGMKVWNVRVDVQALNDDGNLIECASIATIASLAHFKRPHVSVVGTEVTVHSVDDHNPIPLTLHHMPVVVSLALFDNGNIAVVDPLELEERVADGKIVVGVNAHQEICSLHLSGAMMLLQDVVLRCTNIAIKRAQMLTKQIREALDNDAYQKATDKKTGFAELLRTSTILGAKHTITQLAFTDEVIENEVVSDDVPDEDEPGVETHVAEPGGSNLVKVQKFLQRPEVAFFEGGSSRWQIEEDEDSDESSEEEMSGLEKPEDSKGDSPNDSSEEEVYLKAEQLDIGDGKTAASRGWYNKDAFA